MPPIGAPIQVSWLLLIPLTFLGELGVVHLQFRRDARSFSMSEIPLVVGLFLASPFELIAAQFIGNAGALALHRRQRPTKLGFNLSQFALQGVLAVIVFRVILGSRDPLGPAGWAGTVAAVVVAFVVGGALINGAIQLSGGTLNSAGAGRCYGWASPQRR